MKNLIGDSVNNLTNENDLTEKENLFDSYFIGGFECATHRHRPRAGERLDLTRSTRHDEFALQDYNRLHEAGICTARDGVRWHLIERRPGKYDWSSALPLIHAARDTGTQVIWDLCHYGYPDWLDIYEPSFIARFADFARAFALLLKQETDERTPFISPVNEISFFAWAGGDVRLIAPFSERRGGELKAQLVRAAIEAIEGVWSVFPAARVVHADPAINVVANPHSVQTTAHSARSQHQWQYEAWDALCGFVWHDLGGHPKYLDIIGVNYYWNNQWTLEPPPADARIIIERGDALYKPFHKVLQTLHERYKRPLLITETGIEFDARAEWLRFVCDEIRQAQEACVPVKGICWYPIINHPGWDDNRHCQNGLWDYADEKGERAAFIPLLRELERQQKQFAASLTETRQLAETT